MDESSTTSANATPKDTGSQTSVSKTSKQSLQTGMGDKYETYAALQQALAEAGLEACQLIVGIDFTKSNVWTGAQCFGGRSLHTISDGAQNPYQQVLSIVTKTLNAFDDDQKIPCYGFGDVETQDIGVFSFQEDNKPIKYLDNVEKRYRELVQQVHLSGPTSFGPLIRQAMKDVYQSNMRYHILLIIADGQVTEECLGDTLSAIVQACSFPISIIMVGVGDGPWDNMKEFDDNLPDRPWDNFRFVDFNKILENMTGSTVEEKETEFARQALMEIPSQYKETRDLRGKKAKEKVHAIIGSLLENEVLPPPQED